MADQHAHVMTEGTQAPQGSYWPVVLAAALTLTMIGVMTNVAIAALGGLISLVAMVAWGVERFHAPPPPVSPREHESLPALTEGEAEVPAPVTAGRSIPWWGMIWFIATEATFFAFLIASYLYTRVTSETWPPPGTPHAELLFPAVNTVILLASGIPAYFAERAIRQGRQRGLQVGLLLAALLGAIFLGGQIYEYTILGANPDTNVFASGFYILTGFHGAHVAVGIALLLIMLVLSLRGRFSAERHFGVVFASTYWHFVDAVWIFLFLLLYVLR